MSPARISVTIPLSGLAEGIHHLPGQLEYPEWLTYIAVEPKQFTIIIGDSQTLSQEQRQP